MSTAGTVIALLRARPGRYISCQQGLNRLREQDGSLVRLFDDAGEYSVGLDSITVEILAKDGELTKVNYNYILSHKGRAALHS